MSEKTEVVLTVSEIKQIKKDQQRKTLEMVEKIINECYDWAKGEFDIEKFNKKLKKLKEAKRDG